MKYVEVVKRHVNMVDFESAIEALYGRRIDFYADRVALMGGDFYPTYEFQAGPKPSLAESDAKEINQFVDTGKYTCISGVLLDDLATRGIIPSGIYVIDTTGCAETL